MAGEIVLGYDGEPGIAGRVAHRGGDRGRVQAAAGDRVRLRAAADRRRGRGPVEGGAGPRREDHRRSGRASRTRSTRRSRCRPSSSTTARPRRSCARPTSTTRWRSSWASAGRGPIAGALLGSVTYQVVHRRRRPVVVVPSPEGPELDQRSFHGRQVAEEDQQQETRQVAEGEARRQAREEGREAPGSVASVVAT